MAVRRTARPNVTERLMLAMVGSSDAPLLLLDGDLRVIAASHSFGSAFHVDEADAAGRSVFALGEGRWDLPKLRSLLNATATGGAVVRSYEMDLRTGGSESRAWSSSRKSSNTATLANLAFS